MKHYFIQLFAVMTIGLLGLSSCSEDISEEQEYANWQQRNELFLTTLVNDSLSQPGWERFKQYSLDPTAEGAATDYVYVKKIISGDSQVQPAFTDSVRVIYQGRLLPSASYAQGYLFDGTVKGTYSLHTGYSTKQQVSQLIDGYVTALLHMHVGDYWRIYIPYTLGYGEEGNGASIPGYSMLVYDLTLVDCSPAGQAMKPWR